MNQKVLFVFCFFAVGVVFSQRKSTTFKTKEFELKKDTVLIDKTSINPHYFNVFFSGNLLVNNQDYSVDFVKARLIISKKKYPKIKVEYLRYPKFITQVYAPFDKKIIAPNTTNTGKLYSATTNKNKKTKPFNGLKTKGFIARGITTGNNQNAVTNATLDLNLEGNLSNNIAIKASIFDTNFPLQQNGYSQNITDFDRVFVELSAKKWQLKGGDLSLQNNQTFFLNFEKQVAGVQATTTVIKKATAMASGAVVRGKFSAFNFVGIEGNQGPYKIMGANNESGIIMVSGSDRVFVNGIELKRGITNDYTIDYNLAEIQFNTTYPITNDMRIRVEFQYSDRNYTRFVTYEKGSYTSDKFTIAGYFYNENDAKNQPLQQALTDKQKQLLTNAGNDPLKMMSESAYKTTYTADRIQYKKTNNHFEYSTDKNNDLYAVRFANVGVNNGDYEVDKTIAIGTIYKFVGLKKGRFQPQERLIAPTSLQVAVVNSTLRPTENTIINTEVAYSDNDLNLFSTIDDQKNKRLATKLDWKQVFIDKKWRLSSDVNYTFIQEGFKTVQRFQAVEFDRNWNLINPQGNQHQIGTSFVLKHKKKSLFSYGFDYLHFSENYRGLQHQLKGDITIGKTTLKANGSLLNNASSVEKSFFYKLKSDIKHSFGKQWVGAVINFETNNRKNKNTNVFNIQSHRFKEYETYMGFGDSTKVFTKIGVNYRINDSIKNNRFTEINNRKTAYINSKIIQNKQTNLSLYANYQSTHNSFAENQQSLHSKLIYKQQFFKGFLKTETLYETSSGNIAQQDYVYVKTEPGQGYFTWIDYNKDNIKQFNEFEVAKFKDQADYLRVALSNLNYLPTQQAKWNQSVTLNALQWKNKKGYKKVLSHFYNQTHWLIDNKQKRLGDSFNFNPFDFDEQKLLGLSYNIKNSLYFNRNLQEYSFVYTYGKSRNKQQFSIGNQENNSVVHRLEFQHMLSTFWLFDLQSSMTENRLKTENLINRNYNISINELCPKFTFLYHKKHRFSLFYHIKQKENTIGNREKLHQQKLGADYLFISKKNNKFSANINLFLNNFTGNENAPTAYQMLEGLQAGRNYTWGLTLFQKLNSLLHLNMSYFGRKSETSKTIHTGMIELKAVF